MSPHRLSYAVVTPARNEAANLPRLAGALRAQTVAPSAWVLVDNDSTDATAAVARSLGPVAGPTHVLSAAGERVPTRGAPVARAFMAGVAALPEAPDVVVKVDADTSMDPDYFERLLDEFAADPELGLASGTCHELEDGRWVARYQTGDSVRGASRAYLWACLQAVLPLDERTGWDGIDELRAHAAGWRTRSFADLAFRHHRPLGGRDDRRPRQPFEMGRSAHYSGYRAYYLVLSALFRARRQPADLAMIAGYLSAALRREPRCADPRVIARSRAQQSPAALPARVREALGKRSAPDPHAM
jgi:glycosyltransferase involved in cell wall biosynthesis